jgi:putative transposase
MANRPTRLPGFSYVGQLRYFLTICVDQRLRIFDEGACARFVIAQLLLIAGVKQFEVLAYCVMPDHLHALMLGLKDSSDLKAFVDRYKQATGLWWKQNGHVRRLWQEGYHDRILREHDANEGVIRYILLNPVRAGLVSDPREYPFLGASHYDVTTLLESSFSWTPPWK